MFSLFEHRPDVNEGVKRWQQTPGAVLLDVRTPEEYAQGHIPGGVNLPLDRLEEITLDKQAPLFVYCRSGRRSGEAALWLQSHGYEAVNVGGVLEYQGPLEKGDPSGA